MAAITKLTRLQAVNQMLSAIGEAPVNTITGSTNAQVGLALALLDETFAEIHLESFAFNNEKNVLFTPVSGLIAQPVNVLDAFSATVDAVWVDGYLYNRDQHTNLWNGAVYLDVTYYRDFDYVPEAVRRFVAARASRKFYERITDQSPSQALIRDEYTARARVMNQDAATLSANILTGSFGVFRTLNRPSVLDRL